MGLFRIGNVAKVVHFVHHPCSKLCHIITTVHNRLKGGGRVVWLLPLPCYAPPRWEGRQPPISRFRSIVFLCGANKYFSVLLHCICVGTSSASFHRELWDFKSVEHCAIAPMALAHIHLHVSTFCTEVIFLHWTGLCLKRCCLPISCTK